jgi:hypothetical protein
VQLSKVGGEVGSVFQAVEHGLTEQAKFKGSSGGPPDPDYNDCSMTAFRIAFPMKMMGAGGSGSFANFGLLSADQMLGQTRSVSLDSLRVGDIIRYADDKNAPTHFMNAIFTTDEGVTQGFSRTGTNGRFEIVPINAFEGGNYGHIRGIDKHSSGAYRP